MSQKYKKPVIKKIIVNNSYKGERKLLKTIGLGISVAVIFGFTLSIPAFSKERSPANKLEEFFKVIRAKPNALVMENNQKWLSYFAQGAKFADMATHDRSRNEGRLSAPRNRKPDTASDWATFYRSLHGASGGGKGAVLAWRYHNFADIYPMASDRKVITEYLTVALPDGLPATGEKIEIEFRDPATPLAYWTRAVNESVCFSYADTGIIKILERDDSSGFDWTLTIDVRLRFGGFPASEVYEHGLTVEACEPFEFSKTVTFNVAPADFPDPWIPEKSGSGLYNGIIPPLTR